MKLCTQELQNHISNKVTTIATCWKLRLNDNQIVAVTDCDKFLTIDHIKYSPTISFTQNSIVSSLFPFYDRTVIEGLCDEKIIKESDIINGKYKNAKVEIFVLNYNQLSQGRILLFSGKIKKIQINNKSFIAELNGKSKNLFQKIGETFSPFCRAKFCDESCKLDYKNYERRTTVTNVINDSIFQDSNLTEKANYYQYGLVTFITGNNINIRRKIKNFKKQTIYLFTKLPYEISKGDEYSITVECDKIFKTCSNKFNNSQNFRGEPHIPDINSFY